MSKYKPNNKRKRNKLLARDGPRCSVCGVELDFTTEHNGIKSRDPRWRRIATVDHIIPHSINGKNEIDNLRLVCLRCNQELALKHQKWLGIDRRIHGKKTRNEMAVGAATKEETKSQTTL